MHFALQIEVILKKRASALFFVTKRQPELSEYTVNMSTSGRFVPLKSNAPTEVHEHVHNALLIFVGNAKPFDKPVDAMNYVL